MMQSPIAVLGAGAWGTALAMLLARNGQPVRLWDVNTAHLLEMAKARSYDDVVFSPNLTIHTDLAEAVIDVQDICMVVPSFAFREVLISLKPLVRADVRFVWGTKGLDPKTGSFLNTIIEEIYGQSTPIAALSGPSFAKEVAVGMPSAVSLAGNNAEFLKTLIARFQSDNFGIYLNSDLIGLQLCSVVKNVMAIAVGISDGLGYGANTRCALITRGLAELARLCVNLGGQRETLMSLAGVGDLVLTCTDNQSRNRRFGLAIGAGKSATEALKHIGQSVEGYYNVNQLFELGKKAGVILPIANQVYEILYQQGDARKIIAAVLDRTVLQES